MLSSHEAIIGAVFRLFFYTIFGLVMEVFYSALMADLTVGAAIHRRVPKKYLEGFVSLYMAPIHGLGLLFGFEWMHHLISSYPLLVRYAVWCIGITSIEAISGWFMLKILGFYPWDYYKQSPYKIFPQGLTLWTLLPQWGVAGIVLEIYSDLLQNLTPVAIRFFQQLNL